jgi:hypothetical protein
MKKPVDLTEADLRRAWRDCKFLNTTYEKSMAHPALSIAIKRTAEGNVRRQQRLAEQQKHDLKRAQANDLFADYENDNDQ